MRVLQNQEELVAMSFRAWDIYNDEIIGQLTDADFDKKVAIDVDSDDWEVGDLNDPIERLKVRRPNASIVNIDHGSSPRRTIRLDLEAVDTDVVMLVDNQEQRVDVYWANVFWGLRR